MKRVLILMLLLISFTAVSQAADYVWQDVNEADWNSPTWTVGALTNQYPDDVIADNNTNDHSGDNFTIKDNGSANYVTSQVRLRIEGGILTVDNSRLEILPTTTESMAGLVLGEDYDGDGNAVDANVVLDNGATLVVSSLNNGTRTIYLVNGSILIDGGSTLDIADNPSSVDDCLEIESNAWVKVTGNSSILSNSGANSYISLDGTVDNNSYFEFESGSITLDSNNPIQTAGSFSDRIFDWTGSAGAAILTATYNDDPGKELAQKLGLMGIDGVKLNAGDIPDYNELDGPYGNIADINAALYDQPIHGRYFFMTADSNQGQMTLELADTNRPNVDENPVWRNRFPGQSVDFNCVFWSYTTPATNEVVWELNGNPYTKVDDTITSLGDNLYKSTLSIASVEVNDAGDYVCTISVPDGDVNSVLANLLVKTQRAHWKFDGNANDTNGNYDLTDVNGAPTYVAGKIGPNAINFVGDNNDWVYTDLDPNGDWYTGYTVSLWVKNPDPNQSEYTGIFTTGDFTIGINASGGYRYRGGNQNLWLGDYDSDWVNLVVTCDGTTTKTYRNAFEVGNATHARTNIDFFGVGIQASIWPGLSFTGSVDDVKVWNYARTCEQVAQDFYDVSGVPGCCGPIADQYDTNEDCKVDIVDIAAFLEDWLECGLTSCN